MLISDIILHLHTKLQAKKDEAKNEYEKVLELEPSHKEANNNIKLLS